MTKFPFLIDLDADEWAALKLLQDESGQVMPTDALVTSIVRSVINDDIQEQRKNAQ